MHKVLIVDDEKPARELIADFVASCLPDSEITKIDNPLKVMERLQKEDFDILFLDVCMPGMTGLEMLENVSSKGKHPYTVIISAHRNFDYAVKGIELGVVQYITKPLYREKIQEAIRLYLQKTKLDTIELKIPHGSRRQKIELIHAIQTQGRAKVKIFASNAVIQLVTGTLSKMHTLLPAHFRYIRRDCILNYHAIADYNLKSNEVDVICQNEKITLKVSRENMKELTAWLKEGLIRAKGEGRRVKGERRRK